MKIKLVLAQTSHQIWNSKSSYKEKKTFYLLFRIVRKSGFNLLVKLSPHVSAGSMNM